ncbi:hypothetical protein [Veillonella sp.]|uniref:hypothetical protein n=4 Tax=Veillonella sp. TaxID=1926307 RepID=UPI0025D176B3|nr:hypothetical protein [Veillonella sp.]
MPENNFMIFNEAFKEIDTMNDSEYQAATQRQKGVASGVADRRLHNKFYRQASIMVKSLANFIEAQGQDATDEDESVLLDSLQNAFSAFIGTLLESHDGDANAHAKIRQLISNAVSSASSGLNSHNVSSSAHSAKFAEYLKLSTGGTVAGPTTFKSSVTMQAASTIPTQPTSSNNTNIANTAFVKAALLAFLTDRNFIKAVMDAIGSETLSQYGVKYNFDNPNAWSISLGRLFGGLILQGGATPRPSNNATTATFATSFGSTDYIIVPVGVIDANDNKWNLTVNVLKDYKTADSCTFRTSDSIAPACYYLAAGKLIA